MSNSEYKPINPSEPWTIFSFLPQSLDTATFVNAFRGVDLGFRPTLVEVDTWGDVANRSAPYSDSIWDELAHHPEVSSFEFTVDSVPPRFIVSWGVTGIELLVRGTPLTTALVDAVLTLPGFIAGAYGDFQDANWQSETEISHYRFWYDGPWEHLPRTTDVFGDEIIDVSGNPGRISDEVPGIRLWAAQDLWYGPACELIINYPAIPTLPVGTVTSHANGIYHVRLWEDGTPLDQIRTAQQQLRDTLGYDTALTRADEIYKKLTEGQKVDPMFLHETGTFPHGGTKRFLQYFSETKHPTTRSRAAWVNIKEFDDNNTELHDDYIDLTTDVHPE